MTTEHNTFMQTIISALASIGGFIFAHVTKSDIGWFIGCVAGIYAIASGHYTIKEKRMRIKHLESYDKPKRKNNAKD